MNDLAESNRLVVGSVLFGMSILPALAAILSGIAARRRIRKADGRLLGLELAAGGVLLGLLSLLATSLCILLAAKFDRTIYHFPVPRRSSRSALVRTATPPDENSSPFRRYRLEPETAGSAEAARAYHTAMLCKEQEPSQALDLLTDLLAQEPDYEPALLERGLLLAKTQDPEGALRDFDVLVRLRPDNAEAYALRARALAALGEKERALRDYETCLGLDHGGPYQTEARETVVALRKELSR
ncbi:MAG: tetratricopeptide repeat protein [Planctomycetes bacterium]|nr:tetratricopeptide repeat protein [Planctomycetota bacterium]